LDRAVERLVAVRADLSARDEDGHTALLIAAAQQGAARAVCLLLEARAAVDDCDGQGASPLCWAASFGGDLGVIRALVDAEADLTREDVDGVTPLKAASVRGRSDVVRILLEARADPDEGSAVLGNLAGSAISLADAGGHKDVSLMLLRAAADSAAARGHLT